MDSVFIALGSNLGDREQNISKAIESLRQLSVTAIRCSPVFESHALLPQKKRESSFDLCEWDKPYLNCVVEIGYQGKAGDLLNQLKAIEQEFGRGEHETWSPRIVDLDIISFGEESFSYPELTVPHPWALKREFVLAPLKELDSSFILPGSRKSVLMAYRELCSPLPLWMGIINVTPDSFSDGGCYDQRKLESTLNQWFSNGVHIIDIGAESTRPGAESITEEEEWKRLEPALKIIYSKRQDKECCPLLSLDTRHPGVFERALNYGVNILNDVEGGRDPELVKAVKSNAVQYMFMHSLSVPVRRNETIPLNEDPVSYLLEWGKRKIDKYLSLGFQENELIFDPGIGFAKNKLQSRQILSRLEEFNELPVRIAVGHSRKSFMNSFATEKFSDRDWETVGATLSFINNGVDIVRVHNPLAHISAFKAWSYLK